MTQDSIYTDALHNTSVEVTLPEWNRIRARTNVWSRDSEPFEAEFTVRVDGEPVATETVSVTPETVRTAVDRWQRMQRAEVTLEHTVDTAGEHVVSVGETTRTVLTLKPLPDPFRTWSGAGPQGADGEYGLDSENHFILLAGTDTDAWRGVNNLNTIYKSAALEDGGSVTVRVVSQETTSVYTKGGIVVRNDMDAPAGEPGGKGMVRALVSPPDTLDRGGFQPDDEGYGRFSMEWDQNGDGTASGAPFPPRYWGDTTQESVWLRLEKDGPDYTGLYSTDGSTFTEMTTVTVPQAASTQDVGMWGVSLAPQRCRQEFTDFTVTNPNP